MKDKQTILVVDDEEKIFVRELVSISMKNAPRTEPIMAPAPPMMAAQITVSSYPAPAAASAEPNRADMKIPAAAAGVDVTTYTYSSVLSMRLS
jgi:hypothetical protein